MSVESDGDRPWRKRLMSVLLSMLGACDVSVRKASTYTRTLCFPA